MTRVYVALGSNLGDRMRYLQEAVRLMAPAVAVDAVSRVYETDPVGFLDQGAFLNAAVTGETALDPAALLARLKALEAALGRRAGPRNGPREIDLDILLYGALERTGEPPIIPHPAMHERAFVLRPLLDLAPGAEIPGRGPARAHLDRLTDRGTRIWPQVLDLP